MKINCRECDGKALISEIEDVSVELKKLYCLCLNAKCAHSFVMSFSFSHSLKPSAKEENGFLLDRLRELSNDKRLQVLEQLDMLK